MEIKQVDYTQNSQQLLKKLDDYTKVKVPDLTGYESQKISFSIEEASQRLAADGMLIKRPILLKDNTFLTNGFKEADYEGVLGK